MKNHYVSVEWCKRFDAVNYRPIQTEEYYNLSPVIKDTGWRHADELVPAYKVDDVIEFYWINFGWLLEVTMVEGGKIEAKIKDDKANVIAQTEEPVGRELYYHLRKRAVCWFILHQECQNQIREEEEKQTANERKKAEEEQKKKEKEERDRIREERLKAIKEGKVKPQRITLRGGLR